MPAPVNHVSLTTALVLGALFAWRIYHRIGKLIKRQRFHPRRSWIAAIFFPVLAVVLLIGSLAYPLNIGAEFAGIAIGIGLAIYGLRLTKFENIPEGLYYTPNAHIGIVLSLLFAGRVVYRMFQLYDASAGFAGPPGMVVRSPFTLLILGTLVGYYVWYAIGLIRWHRSVVSLDSSAVAGSG